MTGRCTRWERWLPGSSGMFKMLNWNLHLFRLLEIIQVLDSISWVRCASGNALIIVSFLMMIIGIISLIIMVIIVKRFTEFRVQRLGQWPLFRIIFNCFQCWALPATSWKNTHRWRYIIFNPMISYLIIKTNIIFFSPASQYCIH